MDNFIKHPVVGTSDETLSFKEEAMKGCRVPKTNIKLDKSLLFQRVANRNDTGRESLTKTPVQTIQTHRECRLPNTVFKRPLTSKIAFLTLRLSASTIPSLAASD